jgi:ATP-dependent DNA helicase RecG
MLDEVQAQLNHKFLTRPVDFIGMQRVEKDEYPVAALREMLLNTLVHRTYMGAHVQLRVYDDKLSIWNEGGLPLGLTLEELKGEHNSLPRNPKIAKACFMAGYIDTWGRGTLKIYNSCKEHGLPEPDILEKDGGFMVALKKAAQVTDEGGVIGSEKGGAIDGQDGLVDRLVDRLVDGLVESQQKIIKLIQSNPNILIAEMANQIGISKTAIDKNLKILKSKKIIRRVGNSKTGHWEILRNKK